MSDHPDLLSWRPTYPSVPFSKVATGPSAEAAVLQRPRAKPLRQRVLEALEGNPSTADEIAARLGITVLACRPRFSELLALGLIEDTGQARKNVSGLNATVWRTT